LNIVSFPIIQRIIFAISMTVLLHSEGAARASDNSIETSAKDASQSHVMQEDTSKLLGLSRKKAHELLGPPKRSEEFFPYSSHGTIVDYYGVKTASDKHLRITYDRSGVVSATEVESSPNAIPKFMGEKVTTTNLTDIKLRDFLTSLPEDKIHNMSDDQISEKLGKPDRKWHETSRAGGRDWHFLNFMYYLSENGRRAFIVRFNEASNSVYEYRLQSISD
jgi:hypothetical protein